MANDKGFLGGILEAFKSAKPLFMGIGIGVLVYIILLIILGVFNNQVQTGAIAVDNATKTAITNATTQFTTVGTSILSALTSTTGFIVVGVILVLVGGFLGLKGFNSSSSGRKRRRF
jgi:hypothetical protein